MRKTRKPVRRKTVVRPDRKARFLFVGVVALVATLVVFCSSKQYDVMMNVKADRRPLPPPERVEDMPALDFKSSFFAFDHSELTPEGRRALKPTADWLKRNPEVTVQLEGYCDERGSEAYNIVLGEKRAKAAKAFLVSQGIAGDRITVLSFGRVEGATDEVRAQNRRTGVVVIYPKQPE